MKYRLSGHLEKMKQGEQIGDDEVLIQIYTSKEYQNCYEGEVHQIMLTKSFYNMQYCKIDLLKGCAVGTFVIPNKEELLGREICFGFYMSPKEFIFVDDSGTTKSIMKNIMENHIIEKTYVAHFFFEFLEYIISQDVFFMQQYEEKMAVMEEQLMGGEIKDFDHWVLHIRKEILKMTTYYQQLVDLCETMEENYNELFTDEDCRLFSLLKDRISRLYDHTLMLKEYSSQLRELYQSRIDIRQNKIMQFLTVVTTIFMPLTLIVGWYGMNFVNMPELKFHNAYYVIIAVSIVLIIVEIIYFKIKKWFD